ncbi:ribosome biogenesis factor YjgA [Solimonas soli]|uniref:ribosome biogenesis factor YjgA n=1 Tax=Solimonas soli TaxID=413479 RepID=UPI0004B9BB3D|nr:ribosome biogenesis factor YjgA [Solimonas soli]
MAKKPPPLDFGYDGPSKSQVKRDAEELKDLGNALLDLPDAQLDRIGMDERLREAFRTMRTITAHEARRRHGQYLGKLLREIDPAPLRRAIADYHRGRERALQFADRWRDRLLADDAAVTEWIAAHPGVDSQRLRTLIRNARREQAQLAAAAARHAAENPHAPPLKTSPRYAKELLLMVRETLRAAKAAAHAPE